MVKVKTVINVIDDYLEKCSDRTDIPRVVTKQFERFIDTYGQIDHEEVSVYDENGNEIYHNVGKSHSVRTDMQYLMSLGLYNLNSIHNHPSAIEPDYARIPTYFSEADLTKLLITDMDGSYLFHSQTACGGNGYRMTVIRGKGWSDSDRIRYIEAGENLVKNCRKYVGDYHITMVEKAIELADEYRDSKNWKGVSDVKITDFYEQAHIETIKEMGTMDEYLEKNKVYDGFKNAHCKLRIIKSKD